jgi:hypothetical protein
METQFLADKELTQANMFDVSPAHNSLKQRNIFVTTAFHLYFRIHCYRGSRKSEWTGHINFWYMKMLIHG